MKRPRLLLPKATLCLLVAALNFSLLVSFHEIRAAGNDEILSYEGLVPLHEKQPKAAAEKFSELIDRFPGSKIRVKALYWLTPADTKNDGREPSEQILRKLRNEIDSAVPPLVSKEEEPETINAFQTQDATSYPNNWNLGKEEGLHVLSEETKDGSMARHSSGPIPWLQRQLKAKFDFDHSQNPLDKDDQALSARLGLNGNRGPINFWSEYKITGEDSVRHSNSDAVNKGQGKVGAEINLGLIKPKVEIRRYNKYLDHDPAQTMISLSEHTVSLDLNVPHWPTLSLSYGQEETETSSGSTGNPDTQTLANKASATLWYGKSSWQSYLTSTYYSIHDQHDSGSDGVLYDYILGGSYQPINSLTFAPSLEVTQAYYDLHNNETATLYANLGLDYYSSLASLTVSIYGSYYKQRDSDGWIDAQSVDTYLGVEKDLGNILRLPYHKQKLIFKLSNGRYLDRIYTNASTVYTTATLLLNISP
jgi:hypothetical protein